MHGRGMHSEGGHTCVAEGGGACMMGSAWQGGMHVEGGVRGRGHAW